jgi:1,2-diacylglycerol 3-alpha-glucosyltransferase
MADRGRAMGMSPSVAVLFHRIGRYHFARLAAAGTRCELTALELSAVDDTYAWSRVDGASNFKRVTLFCDEDVDRKSGRQVGKSVHAALAAADPQIVAVPGWSRPALSWRCSGVSKTGVPPS